MIRSAKRALLAIDYTKKVVEAIGTSLRAQTMMLHAQGWAAARCFVLLSFFFLSCFLYLSLCIDCKQSALFGEVRRTSQKISAKKRTQIDENLGPDDKYFPLSKNMKILCNETTLISCSSGKTHPK